jgi:uncharacterized protein YqeY
MHTILNQRKEQNMELQTKLQEDMKLAMKSGQKERLGVIRMLLSDVRNIDLAPQPTTAEQAVAAYGKRLRKSLEEYEKIGKAAEVAKLKDEIAIVDEYLPKKASSQETEQWVDDFLKDHAYTEKQFGQAMGAFMKLHGSQVEAGQVNALLKKKLAGR